MKMTKGWLTSVENWWVWIWTWCFKLMVWNPSGNTEDSGSLGVGETFGHKDLDEVSIDITVCSVRMDEVEFWKNASMYLGASNRSTVNSWLLNSRPVVVQAYGKFQRWLGISLMSGDSLGFYVLLLTFPLGDEMAWLDTSCSYVMTSQEKGNGREEMLFSLYASLIGSTMFPWTPKRSSLYHGSEMVHMPIPAPLAVKWEHFAMIGLNTLFY